MVSHVNNIFRMGYSLQPKPKRGFRLIELLVGSLAIIAGLLLPGLVKAKAHGIACMNNPKQLVQLDSRTIPPQNIDMLWMQQHSSDLVNR